MFSICRQLYRILLSPAQYSVLIKNLLITYLVILLLACSQLVSPNAILLDTLPRSRWEECFEKDDQAFIKTYEEEESWEAKGGYDPITEKSIPWTLICPMQCEQAFYHVLLRLGCHAMAEPKSRRLCLRLECAQMQREGLSHLPPSQCSLVHTAGGEREIQRCDGSCQRRQKWRSVKVAIKDKDEGASQQQVWDF